MALRSVLLMRADQATVACMSMQQLIRHIWHNDSGASTPDSVGPDSCASMGDTEDEDECCAHTHSLLTPISPLPTAVRSP